MRNILIAIWTKINVLFTFLFITAPIYINTAFAVSTSTNDLFMTKFHALIAEYKTELTIVLSIGVLLSIVIFIYHCVQLNLHANASQKRAQDISNLLITGICLAAQGSVSVILAIIYYMFA